MFGQTTGKVKIKKSGRFAESEGLSFLYNLVSGLMSGVTGNFRLKGLRTRWPLAESLKITGFH